MRVALFRAREDAERTAVRLEALGHDPVLAPVIEMMATDAALPAGRFDAVIYASAHAVAALGAAGMAATRDVPAFCVGGRTAARAVAAGLPVVGTAEDATRLVRLIRAELPRPGRLLSLAGRHRKPDIEKGLTAVGHEIVVAEIYDARAVSAWPDAVVAEWSRSRVQAALHYSRRSAELALRCAREGGMIAPFRAAAHVCLSEDVAAALRETSVRRIDVARRPDEDSLMDCLAGDEWHAASLFSPMETGKA